MASDTFTLYKLMILYIISKVDFPLSNGQISAFLLDKDYTNYFNIQLVISELTDDNLIFDKPTRGNSLYTITESGLKTLSLFDHLISEGIKEDIDLYLKENKYQLREEVSTRTNYYQIKKNEYSVNLKVIERGSPIIDLTLEVTSEEEAITLCNNWKRKSTEAYQYLLSLLLSD